MLVCLLSACENRTYLGEGGHYEFAIAEGTSPLFQQAGLSLFGVDERILLPLEAPSSEELDSLADTPAPPFPRRPWVQRGDYEIQIDWVVSNLDAESVTLWLTLNGSNEFNEYVPRSFVDNDELIPDRSQWERLIEFPPFGREKGIIREEEIDEVAVDLATVVNGAPNPSEVVHPESQSSLDPRVRAFIPAILPALTGLRIGLRSERATDVVLEATVRVRDVKGRLVDESEAWMVPTPMPFYP